MSMTKKALHDAKKKLYEKDPSFFDNKKSKKKKIIKKQDSIEKRKKIVKWNYKVNDIVTCSRTKKIGLIVSDNQYFGRKVEINYFFVLFGESVKKYDGSYLRKI